MNRVSLRLPATPHASIPVGNVPRRIVGVMTLNKREFLKASGLALTGTMLNPFESGQSAARPGNSRKNWSGNYTYSTDRLDAPATVEEVQGIVKRASKLRALGTRHSFNGIADSTSEQISLQHLDQMALDSATRAPSPSARASPMAGWPLTSTARLRSAQPGISAAHLCGGRAAPPPLTVRAYTTATSRARARRLELVTATATDSLSRAPKIRQHFARRRCGVRRARHRHQPHARCGAYVPDGAGRSIRISRSTSWNTISTTIFGSGYSVSLFTDWQNHRATQVWIKRRRATQSEPTHGRRSFMAPNAPSRSCILFPAMLRRTARSSTASRARGMSACRTSA